ncbi:hypothetical protein CURTO8I2_60117 [Curtobacterium sp. 8I-2]|nr:hypothetical protein CURTO8I2_60117 [Curtobacterium sp. 8I-2]
MIACGGADIEDCTVRRVHMAVDTGRRRERVRVGMGESKITVPKDVGERHHRDRACCRHTSPPIAPYRLQAQIG